MTQKYCLLALVGLLMGSCNDENDSFNPDKGGAASSGELTFVFPGTAKGVVPYADDIKASAQENELETLDIYVFGEDSLSSATPKPMLLEEIFRSGVGASTDQGEQGFALSTVGDAKTATISVRSGKKKSFYFVANGRNQLAKDSVVLQITDTAVFRKKMSQQLEGHISGTLLMSGIADLADVTTATPTDCKVTLVRRMARFDIRNNSEDTNFSIEKVLLGNVPSQTPLFAATSYPATNRLANLPAIDFTQDFANVGTASSVFYMYPADSTATKTISIALGGKIANSGQAQVLNVALRNLKDKQVGVEPNNRYLIDVETTGAGTLNATLTVLDWIEADTLNTETGHGNIKLSNANLTASNVLNVDAEAMTTTETIEVAAEAEWQLVVDPSCQDWIEVTPVAAVAPEVKVKAFTIQTTLANPNKSKVRQGVVMVQNVARPSLRQPLTIVQAANATRYIDLQGLAINNNQLLFSGEKTDKDSTNVTIDVPAGTAWSINKEASATWIRVENEALLTRAASEVRTGTGTETVSIVVDKNTTDQARIDTLTIKVAGEDGKSDLIQKLVVRQAARNLGQITLKCFDMTNDGKVQLAAGGFPEGSRTVTVFATSEWSVEIPAEAQTWLSIDQVAGEDITLQEGFNGYFKLQATANNEADAEERTATVGIINTVDPSIKKEITFVQAVGTVTPPAPAITIDEITDQAIATDGTLVSVEVVCSEGEWTVTSSDAWLTATKNGTAIDLTAEENSEAAERTATVTVTSMNDESVSRTFTVTQAGTTI